MHTKLYLTVSVLLALVLFAPHPRASAQTGIDCDGLPVQSGDIPAGTYTMLNDCDSNGVLTIAAGVSVTINGNGFTIDGGGAHQVFFVASTGSLTLDGITIRSGLAGLGAGINNQGTLVVRNSTITQNYAEDFGGGIYNNGGSATISNTTISDNRGEYDGGGIFNSSGSVTITNSVIRGNSAPNDSGSNGGGIFNGATALLFIDNSLISDNSSPTNLGGGIYARGGNVRVTNSTFHNNSAAEGGALYIEGVTLVQLTHVTIANNTATDSGGAFVVYNVVASVTVTNSIVSNNTAPDGACFINGSFVDGGGNLEDTNDCSFTNPSSLINTSPVLGAFTGFYYPLLDTSPALNGAPDCAGLSIDQLSHPRPAGTACDIGAIEMAQTPTGEVILPVVAAPPTCNEVSDIVSSSLPDGVYCRVLMRNGAWQTQAGTVPGNLATANPILVVDVFRVTGQSVASGEFGGYVQVCLPGVGRLIFLDATTSPRTQTEILPVTISGGVTCGFIPNAGTLALLPN